jgi:hypothetical protein
MKIFFLSLLFANAAFATPGPEDVTQVFFSALMEVSSAESSNWNCRGRSPTGSWSDGILRASTAAEAERAFLSAPHRRDFRDVTCTRIGPDPRPQTIRWNCRSRTPQGTPAQGVVEAVNEADAVRAYSAASHRQGHTGISCSRI